MKGPMMSKRRLGTHSAWRWTLVAIAAATVAGLGYGYVSVPGHAKQQAGPGPSQAKPASGSPVSDRRVLDGGNLPPNVDGSTASIRGTFDSPSGSQVQVIEAAQAATAGTPSPAGVKECAIALIGGGEHVACAANMFADSNLLWVEATAGGPVLSQRTSYAVAGLASPQTARLVAVDSNGVSHDVQLSAEGAFYAPLSPAEIKSGEQIASIDAYDTQGNLIQTEKIH